ncbi:MAG: serine/threonine protein kinase [Calditrichae bacterium]|nr:serine/threonine protein kinase [Calditrichia bacterium]
MPDKQPFKTINEFSFRQLLHEGPYTLVYRGFQDNLKRDVLIKLLKPGSSSELKRRFEREARVYARLNHPNIVSVYALGEKEGWLYIILEYINGTNLRQIINNQKLDCWYITDSILQALEHAAGQGVVHRDIKPENILIDRQGKVKVADFGLARINDEPAVTQQQSLVGTPAYMSPEQITGDEITVQSDLFSLCVVVYEMLFGQKAFGGDGYAESINKILNDEPSLLFSRPEEIAEDWYKFLEKGLQKQKSKRWQTAESARIELQALKPQNADVQNILAGLVKEQADKDEDVSTVQQPGINHFKKGSLISFFYAIFLITFMVVVYNLLKKEESADPIPESAFPDTLLTTESLKTEKADSVILDTIKQKVSKVLLKENNPTVKLSEIPQKVDTDTTEKKFSMAQLDLSITPWAKVYLDQAVLDTHLLKGTFSLPQGTHSLRFEHPRFNPEIKQINLLPGEKNQVNWSFWDHAGYLKIEVRPWAHVYINDEFYDTTPLAGPLRIPEGSKILELRHPSFKNHRERIAIVAGDTLNMKITLQP